MHLIQLAVVASGQLTPSLPDWLRGINHLSVLPYAASVLAVPQFVGASFSCGDAGAPGACVFATGDDVLSLYNWSIPGFGRDLAVLILLTAAYRVVASLALHATRGSHVA